MHALRRRVSRSKHMRQVKRAEAGEAGEAGRRCMNELMRSGRRWCERWRWWRRHVWRRQGRYKRNRAEKARMARALAAVAPVTAAAAEAVVGRRERRGGWSSSGGGSGGVGSCSGSCDSICACGWRGRCWCTHCSSGPPCAGTRSRAPRKRRPASPTAPR